jgi:hypothetical protein
MSLTRKEIQRLFTDKPNDIGVTKVGDTFSFSFNGVDGMVYIDFGTKKCKWTKGMRHNRQIYDLDETTEGIVKHWLVRSKLRSIR